MDYFTIQIYLIRVFNFRIICIKEEPHLINFLVRTSNWYSCCIFTSYSTHEGETFDCIRQVIVDYIISTKPITFYKSYISNG